MSGCIDGSIDDSRCPYAWAGVPGTELSGEMCGEAVREEKPEPEEREAGVAGKIS